MSSTPAVPESHLDLIDAKGIAVFTTVGADGLPQSTAIWYKRDGDLITTSLLKSRQKTKNLVRHPHATLFILDPANPFRSLEIRGDVTFTEDPTAEFMDVMVTHYGQDPATFPAPREGRVKMFLTPRRIVAMG